MDGLTDGKMRRNIVGTSIYQKVKSPTSVSTPHSPYSSHIGLPPGSQTTLEVSVPAYLVYSHNWLLLRTQVSDHLI